MRGRQLGAELYSSISLFEMYRFCKWFDLRSINSSYSVIVRVKVVLKRTVVGDRRFDNLSGSHLQSQVNSVCQAMMLYVWFVDWSVEP